jgi:hypothetical protein
MKFKSINKLFALIIYNKFLKEPSYETRSYYNSRFVNENVCTEGDSSGSKSSYEPVLHSYIWMTYSVWFCQPVAEDMAPHHLSVLLCAVSGGINVEQLPPIMRIALYRSAINTLNTARPQTLSSSP